MGSGQLSGIAETPVMALDGSREDGAFFGAGFVADRYHMVEKPSLIEQVEDTLGLLMGDVDPNVPHEAEDGDEGTQRPVVPHVRIGDGADDPA